MNDCPFVPFLKEPLASRFYVTKRVGKNPINPADYLFCCCRVSNINTSVCSVIQQWKTRGGLHTCISLWDKAVRCSVPKVTRVVLSLCLP